MVNIRSFPISISLTTRPAQFRPAFTLALVYVTAVLLTCRAVAYETDQYLNRLQPVEDSIELMDDYVNLRIAKVVADWQGRRHDRQLAVDIYHQMASWYWVDKIERWAMDNPAVGKYRQKRNDSIYSNSPVWATRVNFFFGIGRSIKVNGVILGTDKLGHFFSQGFKYYKRDKRGLAADSVLQRGAFAERWLFGLLTTGVYSNADLVANYEGMLFYQGLFDNNIVKGKRALIGWDGDRPFMQRSFTWRDHINDYWDEALNPSFVVASLRKHLLSAIEKLCGEFQLSPASFAPLEDVGLWEQYKHIGLKDAKQIRVDRVCADRIVLRPLHESSSVELLD